MNTPLNYSRHRSIPKFLRSVFVLICALCASTAGAAVYTFNNLQAGALAGQDNWMVLNTNQSSDVVKTGTGFDTTLIAGNPGTDNGSGFDVHINGRTNNANFSFGNLSGSNGLILGFDTQVHNITSGAEEFINFGLADSSDAHGSPGLAYFQTANGAPSWAIANASGGSASGSLPATATGDWIRLTFVMDFTTNSGQGTGSLFYTDLTTNGSPQLITSNFGLANPAASDSFWNTMWSRSDFDSGVVIDNLTVIPEINGAWIAAASALLVCADFIRRRRRPPTI